ncbi:MAG: sulfurtransferase-like selenium metabolism protein YedF [Anaerolineae bacterium]|nr:sulfurtransferase-like selenium metabolism protein YedF [Anaerolineae bacterium]
MPTIVDARGKACPQPVILTRRALAQAAEVTVIVDNEMARENVSAMARSQGYDVHSDERSDGTYIHISRGPVAPGPGPLPAATAPAEDLVAPSTGPAVVLIGSEGIGRGSEELGGILMRSFLHTLTEVSPCAEVLVFVNTGVRLVVEGSPVLDDLRQLAERGVQILACGTCLGYFDLKEKVAVGTVSNMYTIAEMLLGASRVVSI